MALTLVLSAMPTRAQSPESPTERGATFHFTIPALAYVVPDSW